MRLPFPLPVFRLLCLRVCRRRSRACGSGLCRLACLLDSSRRHRAHFQLLLERQDGSLQSRGFAVPTSIRATLLSKHAVAIGGRGVLFAARLVGFLPRVIELLGVHACLHL